MDVTARGLNRATLARQLLLERQRLNVAGAVHRVVAIQAQQAASPYIALWNRILDFDAKDLDAAFVGGTLIKAALIRSTLHTVCRDDYSAMHEALQPSLRKGMAHPIFLGSGVSPDDAEAILPHVLAYAATPRTSKEIGIWLGKRMNVDARGVWWALRELGPFCHAPTADPWSFGHRPSYVATRPSAIAYSKEGANVALGTVILRYLEGFEPATVADIAQFTSVPRTRLRVAIHALGIAV